MTHEDTLFYPAVEDLETRREKKQARQKAQREGCRLKIAFVCPDCQNLHPAPMREGAAEALVEWVNWDGVEFREPEDGT